MASKREQILAALKTSLTNTTGVGTRVYRSRVAAVTRAESPAGALQISNHRKSSYKNIK